MIRAANVGDAEAVAGLWNWMIRDTLATFTTEEKSAEAVAALIAGRPGAFFVAEEAAIVTGFATFGTFRAGPGYAATRELSIVIAPAAQGQGIGRALMSTLESAASAQGCRVLVAAISSANPQAVAYHAALGFRQTGLMPQVGRKNGQWLDLVLMQKKPAARP
jgi:phosphinothricin acetyltransferase